jgi:hypothetical protein
LSFSCSSGAPLGSPSVDSVPRGPRLVWQSLAAHVAAALCRLPASDRPSPLGLASLTRSPLNVLVPTPLQGPWALPTPGATRCFPPGGIGRPLLGLGRSAPPGFSGTRPPRPAVPLVMSGGPSPPWPGIPSPGSLSVLVPTPPQGPGALPNSGAPPLRSSRRGWAAAAQVGTLCASAGRWDSPADAPSWPRAICPCITLRLCVSPRPPPQGARGSRPLSRCPIFWGFIPARFVTLPPLPPSAADGPPRIRHGRERGLPFCRHSSVFSFSFLSRCCLLVSVWRVMWAALCGWPVMSSLGVLWGCYLGAGLSCFGLSWALSFICWSLSSNPAPRQALRPRVWASVCFGGGGCVCVCVCVWGGGGGCVRARVRVRVAWIMDTSSHYRSLHPGFVPRGAGILECSCMCLARVCITTRVDPCVGVCTWVCCLKPWTCWFPVIVACPVCPGLHSDNTVGLLASSPQCLCLAFV